MKMRASVFWTNCIDGGLLSSVLASIGFVDTNPLVSGISVPETPKEMSGIRKRNIEIHFFLNEEENNQLNKLAKETNLSKSNLLRYLICGFAPVEAPPADYHKLIREIRAVGNNLNQILVIAKTNGILSIPDLKKEIADLREVEQKLREVFQMKKLK